MPRGVPVGDPAPEFSLSGVGGATVSSETLRNNAHVLVFWNPGCGFCKRLQPDLHEWAGEFGDGGVALVLVTSGTEEQAAEYTFADHIGFDQGFNTGRLFGASGTPSGVLINADGTVGSTLAVGGPSIMELLRANSKAKALNS
jgi:thiol-disulfide isomerase/thioredoxin